MLRFSRQNFKRTLINQKNYSVNSISVDCNSKIDLPSQSDVVIIGGGSVGCYTLYNLAKRGVKTILLERFKLTSGTTWHTNGLMWRIRPNDTDILLLNRTRDIVLDIQDLDFDPGWIQNGGLFIARNRTRIDEYKRLATIAKVNNIEHAMLTPDETLEKFPLLNRNAFVGSLYSPGDGIIDPTMLCSALTRLAIKTSNAKVIENCDVKQILTETTERGVHKIIGLRTDYGDIKTNCIVNATGVWGRDLVEPFGITLPLIPMKHSYVISEPIKGIRGLPNIRDHDASIAFRIQGESIYLGGYEKNPILLDKVEREFSFGLYDLDWSTFNEHINGAIELCPSFGEVGVKCTICGPETFTIDHKPIIGPDPRMHGLFHNCGFNSAGMMFGGGCSEQLTEWILHGRPQFNMFNFDVRRFTQKQISDKEYVKERSHEAYAENYAMVFAHAQPLAGRNLNKDPLHEELILNEGAVMEEKHGYERPAFFYKEKAPVHIPAYDWYGAYDHEINTVRTYLDILQGDQKYGFSDHHNRICAEAMSCRTAAAVFNLCSSTKILIEGPDAKQTLEWICTNDINKSPNSIIHTYALNSRGGVEAKFMVSVLESGEDILTNTKFDGNAFYIVADGSYTNHLLAHINEAVDERRFDVVVNDVTNLMGIISVQGPKSKNIVQKLTGLDWIPLNENRMTTVKGLESKAFPFKLMPNNSLGELGYDLHMLNRDCLTVYKQIFDIGSKYGVKNAGYRAYNSLSLENGTHQWGFDLRSDDTPYEANLQTFCRSNGLYNGKHAIDKQQKEGIHKRLVYLTLDEKIPLWSLEGVYRNGEAVGYLRRADFGYFINRPIGTAYIQRNDKKPIDIEYLVQASYQIDVLGKLYPAKIHLQSPKERVEWNK